jgi:hypothetical protein
MLPAAARQVGGDSREVAPPTVERMDASFAFLRDRVGTPRVLAAAGPDYALFRPGVTRGCGPTDDISHRGDRFGVGGEGQLGR